MKHISSFIADKLKENLDLIKSDDSNTDNQSKKEEDLFSNGFYPTETFKDIKGERYSLNTKLRIGMCIWSILFVSCWLWKVGDILINNNKTYCLSDSVLITLLGTTTLNVLGIVAIAMYDLFNGKSENNI